MTFNDSEILTQCKRSTSKHVHVFKDYWDISRWMIWMYNSSFKGIEEQQSCKNYMYELNTFCLNSVSKHEIVKRHLITCSSTNSLWSYFLRLINEITTSIDFSIINNSNFSNWKGLKNLYQSFRMTNVTGLHRTTLKKTYKK